jgi:uncharacterized protein YjbI with pentapeptide repeats
MADKKQLQLIKSGVKKWNVWRKRDYQKLLNRGSIDLRGADLTGANLMLVDLSVSDLRRAKLKRANLRNADLMRVDLSEADLSEADLSSANLSGANMGYAILNNANLKTADMKEANLRKAYGRVVNLQGSNLSGADIREAYLSSADLTHTNLSGADLSGAYLSEAKLTDANLSGASIRSANLSSACLNGAILNGTAFVDVNLSSTIGLESCSHRGPSSVDHLTLMRSGALPLLFMRGCGLPDSLIEYLPSLLETAIQFYSCFLSYSTKDQEFADRLFADLQNKGVRCWFAPHDIQAGKKIHEQIDDAIRLYDRLLLILSPSSMDSEWVKTEIAKARKREMRESRRMLFPLGLVDFESLRDWECFDADTGKDSAREIREYFIPDFSNWKDHDSYSKAFERLLRDLKAEKQSGA